MNANQPSYLHENDRRAFANALSLGLEDFDRLVASSNHAYKIVKDLGPFYGKEENKEPTFRTTAEPVVLPEGSKGLLTTLGMDLLHLAKSLQSLPEEDKKLLGDGLNFSIPPTWRIDVIVNEKGELKVNEVEGQDGASALMVAEQLSYDLQTFEESTVAKLADTFQKVCKHASDGFYRIGFIRVDNPHNTNADRFIKFLDQVSNGKVKLEHINENDILTGGRKLEWDSYSGFIVETSVPFSDLFKLGLPKDKLISTGIYNAMVNKGVFALFFDPELESFWKEKLGKERYNRLKNILIPTSFIKSVDDLKRARQKGQVVKASWAGRNGHLVNRSRGVAMPTDSVDQGSEDRWRLLRELYEEGITLIAQDYIVPAKIKAFLRKKGITLESVEWYNRVCVKYVVLGDPNGEVLPGVSLTATEVTLGPDVIPAGRKCAFTAGKLR